MPRVSSAVRSAVVLTHDRGSLKATTGGWCRRTAGWDYNDGGLPLSGFPKRFFYAPGSPRDS